MVSFRVELGAASHAVEIGDGLLDRLGELAAAAGLGGRCAVITDTNVARLFAGRATRRCERRASIRCWSRWRRARPANPRRRWNSVYDRLIEAGLDRGASIFALGGGVVGDLAGFAAATFLRGVALVQVPTTLLAQVDSALGGKTAINHRLGKNLIGAIYQPRLIVADVGLLRGLPDREFREGLAEVIKYGAIMDAPFIAELQRDLDAIIAAPSGAARSDRESLPAPQGLRGRARRARSRAARDPELRPHRGPCAGEFCRLRPLPAWRGDRDWNDRGGAPIVPLCGPVQRRGRASARSYRGGGICPPDACWMVHRRLQGRHWPGTRSAPPTASASSCSRRWARP